MEKNMNDGMSLHQSDKPILCANGCGFFGTAATMNLCSKCYRDVRLKEEQAASIVKSMTSSSSLRVTSAPVTVVVKEKEKKKEKATQVAAAEKKVEEEVKKSRCGCCNKKVGVVGFQCRCGNTFCGSHRYPEEHMCEFDFKSVGRDAIKKDNPIIKADKIQRF